MTPEERLAAAYQTIDEANAADPRSPGGQPYELLYGRRMTEALQAYARDAPTPLKLAARAQHLERWKSPRGAYPTGRPGYLRWRADLKKFHAERARELLAPHGYDAETLDRVAFLLQKKKLKRDGDTQTLEDVICHVFLQYYAEDFADEHPDEKVVDILRKTWGKMSEEGRKFALALPLAERVRGLVGKALAEPS